MLEPDERYRIAWRSRIPYDLEFEFTVREMDEPRSMSGVASGELTGTATGGCSSRTASRR